MPHLRAIHRIHRPVHRPCESYRRLSDFLGDAPPSTCHRCPCYRDALRCRLRTELGGSR